LVHNSRSFPGRHQSLKPVRVLHTSDVHIGGWPPKTSSSAGLDLAITTLQLIIEAAKTEHVDAVLFAGDLFDSNRVAPEAVAAAADIFATASLPIVILPGNHDPLTPDSIFERFKDTLPGNVHVFRQENGELIYLRDCALELWGRPHLTYDDFEVLGAPDEWVQNTRSKAWRIAVAHGHYVRSKVDERFSYLFRDGDIQALEADYLALGHWDIHEAVGGEDTPAYYSGSPCRIGSFNLVDLSPEETTVTQVFLKAGQTM